jgi:hypothetical protein
MAKQTFTTGQVLTAAQMISLQQTAMGGGSATAKTASYTLIAADAGTSVLMNSASATTITVNTALFSAGDTVYIQNIGAGVSTITAGTATVTTSATLALAQWEGGTLYFTSTSAAIFLKAAGASAGGGKVLQVVQGSYSTQTSVASTSLTDTGLSLAITPTLNTSKVLVLVTQSYNVEVASNINISFEFDIKRGATSVFNQPLNAGNYWNWDVAGLTWQHRNIFTAQYLDSPATTSSTTYKTQGALNNTTNRILRFQGDSGVSTMTLLEIGA